jgi:hypothetical protein
MLLSLLPTFAFSEAVDLTPPFIADQQHNIGKWTLFGDAQASEDSIIVVPPIQDKKGSVWTDSQFPYTNWSVQFQLSVVVPSFHSGFAIWFVNEFVPTGPFFGGPPQFNGIAIIGDISERAHEYILQIHFMQSLGKEDLIAAVLPEPAVSIPLMKETDLTLQFILHDDEVQFFYGPTPDKLALLQTEPILTNLTGNYLGFSGMTTEYTSAIFLKQVLCREHGTAPAEEAQPIASGFKKPRKVVRHRYYFERKERKLRSPQFIRLEREMELRDQLEGDVGYFIFEKASAQDVFSVLAACDDVSHGLATYGDLSQLIQFNLNSFSMKWSQRKVRLSDSVREMDTTVFSTFNQTQTLISAFKDAIHNTLTRSVKKATALGELISEMADLGLNIDEETESATSGVPRMLLIAATVECVVITLVLILPRFQQARASAIPLRRFA